MCELELCILVITKTMVPVEFFFLKVDRDRVQVTPKTQPEKLDRNWILGRLEPGP